MSYKNPNIQELIDNSTKYRWAVKYLTSRNQVQSAIHAFKQKYNRVPTLDDAEELFKIFAHLTYDRSIMRPKMNKLWYKALTPMYKAIIPTQRDVYYTACRFIEYISPGAFLETPERTDYWYDPLYKKRGYIQRSCGDILESYSIKNPVRFIYKSMLSDEFIAWVHLNKKHLPKYRKTTYQDFSHLAYNGVADDF